MQAEDLSYQNLANLLQQQTFAGRTESASFLAWFLENIFRLDEVSSADAICDGPGDRGVDGIFVDNDFSEIVLFQARVRQRDDRTIGDAPIREFAGSIAQFENPERIRNLIGDNPDTELSNLLVRTRTAELVSEGYSVTGSFVTNATADQSGQAAAEALGIRLFDRNLIADRYIDINGPDGIAGSAVFDISDIGYLEFNAGQTAKLLLLTAKASDLLNLDGLANGTLFSQNVRLNLGTTKVNKDIAKTISDNAKHIFFPMYHNGITLICERVRQLDDDNLEVSNYVVVNGAQSLSVLYNNRAQVTNDLRFIVKVIEIKDDRGLSRDITLFSNNQNLVKPRDLRSNHLLQTRLQEEFAQIDFEDYSYEIKRGEVVGGSPISNEEAGRQLLAFDLKEPWSCHQIYKVFDEKYNEIFGRPAVTAWRIILLDKIMRCIEAALPEIRSEPIQRYRLTKYFLLYSLSKIIDDDDPAKDLFLNPQEILENPQLLQKILEGVEDICKRICVDLRFEFVQGENPPDYKALLKSPVRVQELDLNLRRSFEHDVARGRDSRLSASVDG